MTKIDLITGFLGSGKTTFIRRYVNYLSSLNERVCILENDYGAINVDMLLLNDLKSNNVGLEMVAGGTDADCHRRRFKTKLITMSLLGYDRVIVEPSGIFDMDEFFDLLHEDELYDRYEISNVLSIVDANLEEDLSKQSEYLLASECAYAGKLILSHTQEVTKEKINSTIEHVNQALINIQCKKQFDTKDIIQKPWEDLNKDDFHEISHSGYRETSFIKYYSMDEWTYQSLFFMNLEDSKDILLTKIEKIWKDESVGKILRIKGFVEENGWFEINSTKDVLTVKPIEIGQRLIIVIGENMDEERIESYFKSEFSTISVQKESLKQFNCAK